MNILVLGGIREAADLSIYLHHSGYHIVYSVATSAGEELTCKVIHGPYRCAKALLENIQSLGIELLIDATHPYATQIKQLARQAAEQAKIPLWRYYRPGWQPESSDHWQYKEDFEQLIIGIKNYRRPFFALGHQPLQHLASIEKHQHWLVRCLQIPESIAKSPIRQYSIISGKGPFNFDSEFALFKHYQIDVLVCKNSGGNAVAAKLTVARKLQLPVFMLQRPCVPWLPQSFACIDQVKQALPPIC